MANINEILARAAALRDETALNSIDPERAGGIMYDTLIALNELWLQQGAALVISKIYASVAAMNADTSPVSDLTGQPIRPGMIVVIASSDSDNGSVYRYNGTSSPSWSLVGKIGNLEPVDSLDSDSTQLPLAAHQGKVLDGKISQLGQQVIYDVTMNNSNHPTFASLLALLSDANLSTLIPANVRCGGMSIRFVQTSDNKYVQYMLMAQSFTTDPTQWVGDLFRIDNKTIKLVAFASSQSSLNDGDIYYNIVSKEIRKRKNANQYDVIPFYDGAIYTYQNHLYVWNGTDLVLSDPTVTVNTNTESGHSDVKVDNNVVGIVASVDEVTDLSNSIASSKNLIDPAKCVNGGLDANGDIGTQAYYKTTDFIRLKAGEKIKSNIALTRMFEYDLDMNIILSATATNTTEHTQVNDGYLRASFGTSYIDTIQVEKGENVTDYESYGKKLDNGIALNDSHIEKINKLIEESEVATITTAKTGLPEVHDITSSLSWNSGYGYNASGEKYTGSIKCARIDVSPKDIIRVTSASAPVYMVAFDKSGNVVNYSYYSPSLYCLEGAEYVYVTLGSTVEVTKVEQTSNALLNSALELTYSTNLFDTENFTEGYSINAETGAILEYAEGGYTDFIPVEPGKKVILGDGIKSTRYMRQIVAYDQYRRLLSDKGTTSGGTAYTVPDGVYYVRLDIANSNIKVDSRINLVASDGGLLKYEPFSLSLKPVGTSKVNMLEYNLKNNPLTMFKTMLNSCSYKPLGVLSKPYICLTSDDGYPEMVSKSIPLAIQQDIPITFYIMKGSPVLESSANIQTIKDAIASGNCELGQHGYVPFIDYTEDQLNAYFDSEKEYFDSLELELKSSAPPTGAYTNMSNAVCGGRFGVNRNDNAPMYYGGLGCAANGPRSNIYGLSSLGILGHSLDTNKVYIDLAFNNNWLLVMHFHDFELDNIPAGETTMTLLEMLDALITYAKGKGMTFITASQIPYII